MNLFTPRAQQALALARREADRFRHNYVGTEHLLLGMISLGQGGSAEVLQKVGIDPDLLRVEVEKQLEPGPSVKMSGNIPYTPRVKTVLALAGKEARALGNNYVGTQHLLLGLLREDDGVAARALKTMHCDLERARGVAAEGPNPVGEGEPGGVSEAKAFSSGYARLEEEFRRTREELSSKLDAIAGMLSNLRSDLAQMRPDISRGNS